MTFGLVNYRAGNGLVRGGVIADDRIFEFDGETHGGTLADVYDRWADFEKNVAEVQRGTGLPRNDFELLSPTLQPSGIFCAGVNFSDHVENAYRRLGIPPEPTLRELGLPPWHFLKAQNCLRGDGATIDLFTDSVDWEIELAAIIGRPARNIPVEEALNYVAGYTVGIDLSARDRALRPTMNVTSPFRYDWIAQKSFEGACPLGPALVPARIVGDPQNLAMQLRVNDVLKQDSSTKQMIYSTAEQIAHLSTIIKLSPGDVILTGTPAGTGVETGEFLKSGDVITAWIDKIGTLTVTMK